MFCATDVFEKVSSSLEHCFLFVKSHANNSKVLDLISHLLAEHDVSICSRLLVSGGEVASRRILERQYLDLFKFAEVVNPAKIKLSLREREAFKSRFGVEWRSVTVKHEGGQRVLHAKGAMDHLGVDKYGLDGLCRRPEAMLLKLRKGLYCTRVDSSCTRNAKLKAKLEAPLFVLNSFYAVMRDKYTAPDAVTTCLLLEWNVDRLGWKVLLQNVIGDRDPSRALPFSLRGRVFANNLSFDLRDKPNAFQNVVHVSSSPMEAMFDRLVWVKDSMVFTDLFGSRLLQQKLFPTATIHRWLENPPLEDDPQSLFDRLCEKNSSQCIQYLKFLHESSS
jgi:hypothetical protein